MSRVTTRRDRRHTRHLRVRRKVQGTAQRPRLSVFRSLRHIYVQVVDDSAGHTLVSVSSRDAEVAGQRNGQSKTQVARLVGTLLAQRAKEAGVTRGVFDRGGYRYHGRVKALAEAIREVGLEV